MTWRMILLSPVLLVQALWVVLRASRLPEACGPRQGQTGSGPVLRVLILGDSSAAGVGVEDQQDALGGQLAQALGRNYTVHWQVIAKSGGTAASTCDLLQEYPPEAFDVAVIALGVNDAKNGVSVAAWARNYRRLLDLLGTYAPDAKVVVSRLPDLGAFPLLPAPLCHVLGARAALLDTALHEIASTRAQTEYLGFDIPLDPAKMARDGFHPGAEVYTYWAEQIATRIR